jgi:hypothetical protein
MAPSNHRALLCACEGDGQGLGVDLDCGGGGLALKVGGDDLDGRSFLLDVASKRADRFAQRRMKPRRCCSIAWV